MNTMEYREVQQFRQKTTWVFMAAVIGFILISLLTQFDVNDPNMAVITVMIVVGFLLPLFMWKAALLVEVNGKGIFIKHSWLFKKNIPFDRIESYTVRTYSPVLEYGGWGVKWTPWRGWVYNIGGNRGVQFVLKNKQRIMIGSRKSDELYAAVKSYMQQKG